MDVPVRVEVVGGARVVIEWADGVVVERTAGELRRGCRCADCQHLRERRVIRLDGGGPPTITDAQTVGAYGIQFTFGPDGHRTGIFRWDRLREESEPSPG